MLKISEGAVLKIATEHVIDFVVFGKVVIQQIKCGEYPTLKSFTLSVLWKSWTCYERLGERNTSKVLGHDDSAIFVVSFQNMSQHLSFSPRLQQSGKEMLTNRHAHHFIFLSYVTGAGSCCINSRLWISWDCTCLVTAYITSPEPHMAGLCSRFYSVLYNVFATKTKSGMPSAGDASTHNSLSKNNEWFGLGSVRSLLLFSPMPLHNLLGIQKSLFSSTVGRIPVALYSLSFLVVERGMWVTVADALPPCAALTYSPAYRSVSYSHLHVRRGVCGPLSLIHRSWGFSALRIDYLRTTASITPPPPPIECFI